MVEAAGTESLRSKWPNDLVANGRKVGGILAEGRVASGELGHIILGVGVNVATRPEDFPPDLRDAVGSVAEAGGTSDPAALMESFLRSFRDAATAEGFPGGVVDRYAAVCATLGRTVRAVRARDGTIEGTAVGLDERGGLIVEREGLREIVAFGEIEHLR